jgi:hypothetical protein
VRVGPVTSSPVAVGAPLSSETTVFHTATNGGSGSAVNDDYPLAADSETTK